MMNWIVLNSSLSARHANYTFFIVIHKIADPLEAACRNIIYFFLSVTPIYDPRNYYLACGRDESLACFNRNTISEPRSRSTREMHRLSCATNSVVYLPRKIIAITQGLQKSRGRQGRRAGKGLPRFKRPVIRTKRQKKRHANGVCHYVVL